MTDFRIPNPIYEHLPKLYLIAAALVSLVELSSLKWVAVVALILAASLTLARRRTYRAAQRRAALRRYVAERYGKTVADLQP